VDDRPLWLQPLPAPASLGRPFPAAARRVTESPTLSKLHIGALLDRAPGPKYTAALRFAELALRAPLPRPGTIASQRARLPADFVLGLRAPRSSMVGSRGALRMDAELEAGLAWLLAAADAAQARAVVFNTPADLTPGARSRELLRDFVARLPRSAERHYVWLPQGVWEPETAAALSADLGLVYGYDPLETRDAPASDVTYATLRALGHRAGFSTAALSDALVATLAHGPSEAFFSVDAERAFDIARRLTSTLEQAALEAGDQPLQRAPLSAAGVEASEEDGELEDDDELEGEDDDDDDHDEDDDDHDDEEGGDEDEPTGPSR
jgi:uncharacterized protein YecE (DUF72 family)